MSLLEKFIDYVQYETTSHENVGTTPSTACQFDLAKHLLEELKTRGVKEAFLDEHCYVYGYIEGNTNGKTIGLIAHMDTSDAVSGKNVKPRVIENYDGKDIVLNKDVISEVSRFTALNNYIGKTLVVTDGTTLLGADDKAGIAIIMEVVETLINHPEIKHGPVRVCFNPDEEIGGGMEKFNYDWFKVDYAYTLDGAAPNELEFECFNACSANVVINGISTHPGDAKDKMVNALNVAYKFHSYLDPLARPEHTEKYQGFNHLNDMNGSVERCEMHYIIRNHDRELLEKQKSDFRRACALLNKEYGYQVCELTLKDSYRNMREKFKGHTEPITTVKQAMAKTGLDYKAVAIRGGTDGAVLTFNGILTPNLGTGGLYFHGVHEIACLEDMQLVYKLVLNILDIVK